MSDDDFQEDIREMHESVNNALDELSDVKARVLKLDELKDFKAAQYALRNLSDRHAKNENVAELYKDSVEVECDESELY